MPLGVSVAVGVGSGVQVGIGDGKSVGVNVTVGGGENGVSGRGVHEALTRSVDVGVLPPTCRASAVAVCAIKADAVRPRLNWVCVACREIGLSGAKIIA